MGCACGRTQVVKDGSAKASSSPPSKDFISIPSKSKQTSDPPTKPKSMDHTSKANDPAPAAKLIADPKPAQAPSPPAAKPKETDNKRIPEQAKPVPQPNKPLEADTKPKADPPKPVEPEKKPISEPQKPAESEKRPVIELPKLAGAENKPVTMPEEKKPAGVVNTDREFDAMDGEVLAPILPQNYTYMDVQRFSLRDRLYMPPLKKYKIHGLFPWKIAIHLLLVIMTTCQVILVVNRSAMYSLGHNILWNKLFLDKNANGVSEDTTINSYNLFSAKEVTAYVEQVINSYYNVNTDTLSDYSFKWHSGLKDPPKLWVEYLDDSYVRNGQFMYEYSLTRIDLGPLKKETVKEFLGGVRRMQLRFELNQHLPGKMKMFSDCYKWTVVQTYNFGTRGPLNVSMQLDRTVCNREPSSPVHILYHYQWISISVSVLSLISFIIVWAHIMRRALILVRLQGQSMTSQRAAWESLGLKDKLKFFNFWVIITVLGNLLQFFGGLISITDEGNLLDLNETLIGFGCFFAWVGIVGHLEHNSPAYTIINTVKRAAPILLRYIIGVMPIFMAYAFLGIALFWSTSYFPNPLWSMMILFANVNGDSLYMLLSAATNQYFFLGQAYYFSFLVFFIWYQPLSCVQNLFVALTNEGFLSLIIRPVLAGDDEDDEDESDFRPELYSYSAAQPKVRTSDKDVKAETSRKTSDMAKEESTKSILVEMSGIENQLEDLLKDVLAVYSKEKSLDADMGAIAERVLEVMETEIPEDIKAALE